MYRIYFLQVGESVALEKVHKKAAAEDPLYAIEQNLPIDAHHYREHHLSQPLLSIFKLSLGEKKAKSMLTGIVCPGFPIPARSVAQHAFFCCSCLALDSM
jgi:hypothetical protein